MGDARPVLHVADTRSGRSVLTRRLGPRDQLLAVDGVAAYVRVVREVRPHHRRWDLCSCGLGSERCHLSVSVRPRHLIGPGGWSPPAA